MITYGTGAFRNISDSVFAGEIIAALEKFPAPVASDQSLVAIQKPWSLYQGRTVCHGNLSRRTKKSGHQNSQGHLHRTYLFLTCDHLRMPCKPALGCNMSPRGANPRKPPSCPASSWASPLCSCWPSSPSWLLSRRPGWWGRGLPPASSSPPSSCWRGCWGCRGRRWRVTKCAESPPGGR